MPQLWLICFGEDSQTNRTIFVEDDCSHSLLTEVVFLFMGVKLYILLMLMCLVFL